VVGISYNASTDKIEFGQFDLGETITISGTKLTINVASDTATKLHWTNHFDIIKASEIVGDYGTFAATGLGTSGFRFGHRRRLQTAPAIDTYFVDVLTYTSSAAPGQNILVRGDFNITSSNTLPAGFQFYIGSVLVSNATIQVNNANEIRVRVPTMASGIYKLKWSPPFDQTITNNNFTIP
jgi:hypothetical protein